MLRFISAIWAVIMAFLQRWLGKHKKATIVTLKVKNITG